MHRKFCRANNDHRHPKLSKPFRQPQRDNLGRSFAGIGSARRVEDDYGEPSAAISELFQGFLAISPLDLDPNISEPSTPTFSISSENIMQKETEVAENEMTLMNNELAKVLRGKAKEVGHRGSSSSPITLSGKPAESPEETELSETTIIAKREQTTTLGELLQRTKIEENCAKECGKEIK